MTVDEYVPGSLWFYAPNQGAALFFTIAFLVLTLVHTWQCYHYKCFRITTLFIVSGFFFALGFTLRAYGSFGHYGELITFILSLVFIAICPPFLALANYTILGRVLYYVPYLSPLHPGKVLTIFGTLTMVIEAINGIGAAFASNPKSSLGSAGPIVMYVSLGLQFAVIASFLVLAGHFHWRCLHTGSGAVAKARGVRIPLLVLYTSSSLILARTVFRAVEQNAAAGKNGRRLEDTPNVIRYEWYFLVFEGTIMLVNIAMWNIWHPRRYLPDDIKAYISQDGMTVVTDPPFWQDGTHKSLSRRTIDMFGLSKLRHSRSKSGHSELLQDGEELSTRA